MNRVKICVLPGDGIGPEVTAETVKVLKVLVAQDGICLWGYRV
jgi:isocitrate/isopropylmalate dehydrogenase